MKTRLTASLALPLRAGGFARFVIFGSVLAGSFSGVFAGAFEGVARANDRYTTTATTVYDKKTKLLWQRNHARDPKFWAAAVTYCPWTYGTGWRLPTIKELQTLVDYSKTQHLYDEEAFQFSDPDAILQSATPFPSSSGSGDHVYVYLLTLANGNTVSYDMTVAHAVLCVSSP